MSTDTKLYDTLRPVKDDSASGFEPIELREMDGSSTVVWGDGMTPIEWLFTKDGRGKLVATAMQEAADGDPVYLNKSKLAELADVSRHSCHRHLDDLVNLGLYEKIDEPNSHTRYRPNPDSEILRALYTANREIEEYATDPLDTRA